MSSRLWQQPVQGLDILECMFAGNFAPQGSSAPTINSDYDGKFSVARSGTGTFVVTLFGASGWVNNNQASIQIDSNGSDLTLQVVPGPVSEANGNVTVTLYVQDTTTGVLTDITQPVTPSNNGSAIHFLFMTSSRNTLKLGSL